MESNIVGCASSGPAADPRAEPGAAPARASREIFIVCAWPTRSTSSSRRSRSTYPREDIGDQLLQEAEVNGRDHPVTAPRELGARSLRPAARHAARVADAVIAPDQGHQQLHV